MSAAPRVLVVRFRAIGDCVMTAWPVTALRSRWPQATIVWATEPLCAPVIHVPALADELVVFDRAAWKKSRWSPGTWINQVRTYLGLRRYKFDIGFDFQGHSKTALALRLASPVHRFAMPGTDALARRLNPTQIPKTQPNHMVERMMALVREAESCPMPKLPMLPELDRPDVGLPARYVVINTGASAQDKLVPLTVWTQLAEALQARGVATVAIGGPADASLPAATLDLVGRTSLVESVGIVRGCMAHYSGDTGTGHLAAGYGLHALSVFMSDRNSPSRYRPFGPHGAAVEAYRDPGLLSAAALLEPIRELLDGTANASLK